MSSLLIRFQSRHLDFRVFNKSTHEQPLQIIGVGLGRTGTMSLRKALQILYDKPCYHMSEILLRHQDHIPKWVRILEHCREHSVECLDSGELEEIFKDYAMADGHPACCIYEKLIELYPDAKIILTTRDSDRWLESYRETVGHTMFKTKPGRWNKFLDNLVIDPKFRHMAALSMQCALGWNLDFEDDEAVKRAYETRNDQIRERIPPERLLCFNVKDGWEPLCQFLDKPIPDEPFPHVNGRTEMQLRLKRLEQIKMFLAWSFPILILVLIAIVVSCMTRD